MIVTAMGKVKSVWLVRPDGEPIPPGQTAQNAGVAVYHYSNGRWGCQEHIQEKCEHIRAVQRYLANED